MDFGTEMEKRLDKRRFNMKLDRMIAREINKSNGQIKIVKVPAEKRPKAEDLKKLDCEIRAQVSANEAMSSRSMLYASKTSIL